MLLEKLRKFLETPAGRGLAGVLVVAGVLLAVFSARGALTSDAEAMSREGTTFIDADTKLPFKHVMVAGESIPVVAPSGGKGFIAEFCNWTPDGHVSADFTPVLMNQYVGIKGPTFCPTCGRVVTMHNELGVEGAKPPPTKEEMTARK